MSTNAIYRAVEALPAVVPDHGHGGVNPPYLQRTVVLDTIAAAVTPKTDREAEVARIDRTILRDALHVLQPALGVTAKSIEQNAAKADRIANEYERLIGLRAPSPEPSE